MSPMPPATMFSVGRPEGGDIDEALLAIVQHDMKARPVVRCFQPTHRNATRPSANRSAPLLGTQEVDPIEGVCSNTSGQWNKQGVVN